MISNRGVKVYPDGFSETFCTDHWRCRVLSDSGTMTHDQVIALLSAVKNAGLDFIKTEHLVSFDGQKAYSLGQGE
jgi:isocitrate dehydrogenase